MVKTIDVSKRFELNYFERTRTMRLWDKQQRKFVGRRIILQNIYPKLKKVV